MKSWRKRNNEPQDKCNPLTKEWTRKRKMNKEWENERINEEANVKWNKEWK